MKRLKLPKSVTRSVNRRRTGNIITHKYRKKKKKKIYNWGGGGGGGWNKTKQKLHGKLKIG